MQLMFGANFSRFFSFQWGREDCCLGNHSLLSFLSFLSHHFDIQGLFSTGGYRFVKFIL